MVLHNCSTCAQNKIVNGRPASVQASPFSTFPTDTSLSCILFHQNVTSGERAKQH